MENKYALNFSEEELNNTDIKLMILKLIDYKIKFQKTPYLEVSEAEFYFIKRLSEFVPKKLYENQTKYKGEVGKFKGKRLVLISSKEAELNKKAVERYK